MEFQLINYWKNWRKNVEFFTIGWRFTDYISFVEIIVINFGVIIYFNI